MGWHLTLSFEQLQAIGLEMHIDVGQRALTAVEEVELWPA